MSEFTYIGTELDLFSNVHHWKSYWHSEIKGYLRGDILEVGAGIGANTLLLSQGTTGRFVCMEPDAQLSIQLAKTLQEHGRTKPFETVCGTMRSLGDQRFHTILYIDVLEHIENDREELRIAASHLLPGGHLIVLSPAHQRLFSPFDRAIGHFRRYDKSMIRAITPTSLHIEQLKYLDSVGLTASCANSLLLRQSMPTESQLKIWDCWIVPVSRVTDKLLFYSIGKSILAVWKAA